MTDQGAVGASAFTGDPAARRRFADRLAAALAEGMPGSTTSLRGSLGRGAGDRYSDIDLAWVVPDRSFGAAIGSAVSVLAAVAPVISCRSDPDHQRSDRRRLLFVRFAGVPLFWRLDLEVWAESVALDASVDDDPAVRGGDWCPYESALMNALGAVKTVRRGRTEEAGEGLTRGFERVGASPHLELTIRERIVALTEEVAGQRPHLRTFAVEIAAAAGALLAETD